MQHRELVQRLFRTGSRLALTLVDGTERRFSWSWQQLQCQRRYCEAVLRAADLTAGDSVLVMTANNPQFFALLLATISLRLQLLPVHPDFASAALQRVLTVHRPALVIIDDPRQLRRLPHCRVLRLHERQRRWLQPLQHRCCRHRSRRACDGRQQTATLLFHSSGSTGAPKGIGYTSRMLDTFLRHLALLYAAFPDDASDTQPTARVNALPVTHWGGLSFCLQALLEGRTLHLWRGERPQDHLLLLQASGCRLLMLVPSLLYELLQAAPRSLPAVRHCLAMGEAITITQLQQLTLHLGVRVHNAYGMSECLTGIFNTAEDSGAPVGSCGRQQFGEVKLIDDDGQSANCGELCVRNATTTPCYTDAALNRQRYRQGWYCTGDRFWRDADGYYFFIGRTDSMCVINGRNIYPHEVEQVMRLNPAIKQCVVTPVTTVEGTQRLAVAVVMQPGATADANELLDFYLVHGARFATPVSLQFWRELPRLPGKKIDRQRCAAELQKAYEQTWQQHDEAIAP